MRATIRLFNALPIEKRQGVHGVSFQPAELLSETIKRGFVFSAEVFSNYPNYDKLIEIVEEAIGITGEKANTSFHKSWAKVQEADIEQLVIEQIVHYLTTYGGLGDIIYIPEEKLDIPKLDINGLKLIVIKGYTQSELKEKLLSLLNSGIALGEDTIKDIVDVALYVGISDKEIENIKNKEVRVILYDYLGIIPSNPIEFLRSIIYQTTDETLLIKSKELIAKIKDGTGFKIIKHFKAYDELYGLNGYKRLAEIFYRFKPLWLAFRTNPELKRIINRIRRLAREYHKPMPEDYLNTITAKIKHSKIIYKSKLGKELEKTNIFRKIKLAYALKFRTKDISSILYRIRNGKAYAKDFQFCNHREAGIVLETVLDSIIKDIEKNVKGKKIYVPDYINYTLPATEKQFTGNFPSGTYISVPRDMIFGVHWENVKYNQIDLDLSLISPSIGKIGWDGNYRDGNRNILYSGDITNAPKPEGASELFYIKKQYKNEFVFFLNYYNYNSDIKVPFKIIIAKEKAEDFEKDYMVNPNNIITVVQSEISQKQKVLGLIVTTMNENRFYFAETSIGKSITSSNSEFTEHTQNYLMNFYQNSIELEDILLRAGAFLTNDVKADYDIDLSPENLEKDTILNLLK